MFIKQNMRNTTMTYHWQSGGDLQNVIQAQAEMYLYTSYCSYSPRFPLSTSALQFMWSSTPPYLGIYVLKKRCQPLFTAQQYISHPRGTTVAAQLHKLMPKLWQKEFKRKKSCGTCAWCICCACMAPHLAMHVHMCEHTCTLHLFMGKTMSF